MKKENLVQLLSRIASTSDNLAADFVFELGEIIEAIPKVKSLSVACSPLPLERIAEMDQAKERKRISQLVQRLEKKKQLKIRKKAGRIEARLTEEGSISVLQEKIRRCEEQLPVDHFVIVSFDIPEVVKEIRNKWRHMLRGLGFRQLHRSVWISNFNVARYLIDLVKLLKADDWISVFNGKSEI